MHWVCRSIPKWGRDRSPRASRSTSCSARSDVSLDRLSVIFGRWMIRDTDRAAAGFLFQVIQAAKVDQPEQVVGQSWVRFQVAPVVAHPCRPQTKAAAPWRARRLHAHRRGTLGRSFPAATLPRPGRRLAAYHIPRLLFLGVACFGLPDPSTERTPFNLRRSHRPRHPRALAAPRCLPLLPEQYRDLTNGLASPTISSAAAARRGYSFDVAVLMPPSTHERLPLWYPAGRLLPSACCRIARADLRAWSRR